MDEGRTDAQSFEKSGLRHSQGRAPLRVSPEAGFVGVSVALVAFFIASGAPTPLLPLYEREWGFAPSMLTLAFGVYAIALLLTLLVMGSLSDHIGRRPILIGALALEFVAMTAFLLAPSIGWIIAARVVQGVATGAASSSFGAAVVELAPHRLKKLGALMSSLASTAGLGLGALFAGVVAQFIPAAAASTVWLFLAVVMAAGTLFAVFTPETIARRPGAVASLTPWISLPHEVRRHFATTVPGLVGTFMTTALFLGLIPIVLTAVFRASGPIVGALAAFVMFTFAAAMSAAGGAADPHRLKIFGNVANAAGAVLFIAAIALDAFTLIWLSAILTGIGAGATFSGTIRGLVLEVKAHERAGVFTAIFTVSYLALGLSAIIAGFVATSTGVRAMAIGFGTVLAVIVGIAVVLSVGLARRSAKTNAVTSNGRRTTNETA